MGTTPTYGYPYPEPTDLLRNDAAATRALAEHAEAREDAIRADLAAGVSAPPAASYAISEDTTPLAIPADPGGPYDVLTFSPIGKTNDWDQSASATAYLSGPRRLVLVTAHAIVHTTAAETRISFNIALHANGGPVATAGFLLDGEGVDAAEVSETLTVSALVGMNPGDYVDLRVQNNNLAAGVEVLGRSLRLASLGTY